VAFLTAAFLRSALGTRGMEKLAALSPEGSLATHIALADARATAAARRAGYTSVTPDDGSGTPVPSSGVAFELLRSAALRAYVEMAWPLSRDVPVPEDLVRGLVSPEEIASGAVPLPGLAVGDGAPSIVVIRTPGEDGGEDTGKSVYTPRSLRGFGA